MQTFITQLKHLASICKTINPIIETINRFLVIAKLICNLLIMLGII